jgi:predicted nucleic acid-binding protein
MLKESEQKATLDTCILFPVTACDVLLTLAEFGMFQPIWSSSILNELLRATLDSSQPIEHRGLRKRVEEMNEFFPYASHDAPSLLVYRWQLVLPDPKDGHVVATAIASKSSFIVTENLKDFPNHLLAKSGIVAMSFDSFMNTMLTRNPESVHKAFKNMIKKRTNPQISLLEQLLKLEKLSPNFNREFRKYLNTLD